MIPRLWLYGIAGAALLGLLTWAGLTVNGWRTEAARVPAIELERDTAKASVAAFKEANDKAVERQRKDDERMAKLLQSLDGLRTETARLASAARRVPATTIPEPTSENPHPVPRLSGAWGVCFAALAAGDPADVAACEASSGGVRDPVSP